MRFAALRYSDIRDEMAVISIGYTRESGEVQSAPEYRRGALRRRFIAARCTMDISNRRLLFPTGFDVADKSLPE